MLKTSWHCSVPWGPAVRAAPFLVSPSPSPPSFRVHANVNRLPHGAIPDTIRALSGPLMHLGLVS